MRWKNRGMTGLSIDAIKNQIYLSECFAECETVA